MEEVATEQSQQPEHRTLKLSLNTDSNHQSRALLYGIGAFLIMIIALVVGFYLGSEGKTSQVAGASTSVQEQFQVSP